MALGLASACGGDPSVVEPPIATAPACPPGPIAEAFAPGADAALERGAAFGLDTPGPILADDARLSAHRAKVSALHGGGGDPWRAAVSSDAALADARRRLASFEAELRRGEIVEQDRGAIAAAIEIVARAGAVDHARLVVTETQLFCAPADGGFLRLPERDASFDRNACTSLHPGELLRVLARGDGGRWWLVDAGHTQGWVRPDGLGDRLAEDDRIAWRGAPKIWSIADDVRTVAGVPMRLGVGWPLVSRTPEAITVRVATANGVVDDALPGDAAVTVGFAPLRRADVLRAAFAQIGAPYGWGGRGGARDCSQFLRDTFLPFGVELPRHSSVQAQAGFTTIDVAGWSAADKLAAIDRASADGLVLEYMPGHIMLDVGAAQGCRWSISAIAEFLVPCPDGGETVHRLDRVALTDLELGRGSSRGAFIDRITTLAVFGP
ncbi:MAG: SH3 domain-containing protein [Myxococcales bacterium]|nr:SH3 domain-containing protein [Myxococcales bacterium]